MDTFRDFGGHGYHLAGTYRLPSTNIHLFITWKSGGKCVNVHRYYSNMGDGRDVVKLVSWWKDSGDDGWYT